MTEIVLSDTKKIVIEKTEFRGQDRVDIRQYYLENGIWYPTKKGVSLPADDVVGKALLDGVAEAFGLSVIA